MIDELASVLHNVVEFRNVLHRNQPGVQLPMNGRNLEIVKDGAEDNDVSPLLVSLHFRCWSARCWSGKRAAVDFIANDSVDGEERKRHIGRWLMYSSVESYYLIKFISEFSFGVIV